MTRGGGSEEKKRYYLPVTLSTYLAGRGIVVVVLIACLIDFIQQKRAARKT